MGDKAGGTYKGKPRGGKRKKGSTDDDNDEEYFPAGLARAPKIPSTASKGRSGNIPSAAGSETMNLPPCSSIRNSEKNSVPRAIRGRRPESPPERIPCSIPLAVGSDARKLPSNMSGYPRFKVYDFNEEDNSPGTTTGDAYPARYTGRRRMSYMSHNVTPQTVSVSESDTNDTPPEQRPFIQKPPGRGIKRPFDIYPMPDSVPEPPRDRPALFRHKVEETGETFWRPGTVNQLQVQLPKVPPEWLKERSDGHQYLDLAILFKDHEEETPQSQPPEPPEEMPRTGFPSFLCNIYAPSDETETAPSGYGTEDDEMLQALDPKRLETEITAGASGFDKSPFKNDGKEENSEPLTLREKIERMQKSMAMNTSILSFPSNQETIESCEGYGSNEDNLQPSFLSSSYASSWRTLESSSGSEVKHVTWRGKGGLNIAISSPSSGDDTNPQNRKSGSETDSDSESSSTTSSSITSVLERTMPLPTSYRDPEKVKLDALRTQQLCKKIEREQAREAKKKNRKRKGYKGKKTFDSGESSDDDVFHKDAANMDIAKNAAAEKNPLEPVEDLFAIRRPIEKGDTLRYPGSATTCRANVQDLQDLFPTINFDDLDLEQVKDRRQIKATRRSVFGLSPCIFPRGDSDEEIQVRAKAANEERRQREAAAAEERRIREEVKNAPSQSTTSTSENEMKPNH